MPTSKKDKVVKMYLHIVLTSDYFHSSTITKRSIEL